MADGVRRTDFESRSMLHFLPCGDSLPTSISCVQPRVSIEESNIPPYTPTPGGYLGGGSIHISELGFELRPYPGNATPFRYGFDQAFHRPSQVAFQKPFNLSFVLAFKRRLNSRPDLGSEVFPLVFSVVFSLVCSPARSLVCSPCLPARLTARPTGLLSCGWPRRAGVPGRARVQCFICPARVAVRRLGHPAVPV